jgi:trans-aconitate methyltransferase
MGGDPSDKPNSDQSGGGSLASLMRQRKFSGRSDAAALLARRALDYIPAVPFQAILDLGCGVGDLAVHLKKLRPESNVVGIDFSPRNVEAARGRHAAIRFELGDYLEWNGGTFSAIVADSVLHLIEAPVDQIAKKIAADLRPDGFLVATVPDDALRNHALLLARRLYRTLPPGADRVAVRLASLLHPGLSREALAERIPYMRMLPRLFGPAEQAAFAAAGLQLIAVSPWPSASLVKPRHRLMVWRRA